MWGNVWERHRWSPSMAVGTTGAAARQQTTHNALHLQRCRGTPLRIGRMTPMPKASARSAPSSCPAKGSFIRASINDASPESSYALKHLQADKGTWYWAVDFSRNGRHCYRRFYEPMYGGSEAAQAAAIAWRDERLVEVKALGILEFCGKKRTNNRSGEPGVHFLTPPAQPQGIWQAKLKLADGARATKTFSVRRHGHQAAYDMAVAARREMLRQARDRPYVHDALAQQLAARQAEFSKA